MTAVIHVSDLVQGYGRTVVLRDIDLTVESGRIVALIGPSAAGKTTLISTIMGMLRPKRGEVEVLGHPMPDRELLAQVGYMAQTDALYEELSGKENLSFFATMQGVAAAALKRSMSHATGVVDLSAALNRPVRDYSGGMKRRLSLAIALISDPALLILDEPTIGIDPKLRRKIWSELRALADRGRAILLTTHIMDDAEEADRVVMIRGGRIIAQGAPDQLMGRYGVDTVEAVFLRAGGDQDAHDRNHEARGA